MAASTRRCSPRWPRAWRGSSAPRLFRPASLESQSAAVDIALAEPDRGDPYTPIAFLVDYAHGWEPAPFWPNAFKNWHGHQDRFLFGDHEKMLEQYFWTAYHPIGRESERPITGTNEVWKIEFENGAELKVTPNHRIWTINRGMVEAKDLTNQDRVKVCNVETHPISADFSLPISTRKEDYLAKGDWKHLDFELPEKWDEEFAYYLGWLVGDGCISGNMVTTVYAGEEKGYIDYPALGRGPVAAGSSAAIA